MSGDNTMPLSQKARQILGPVRRTMLGMSLIALVSVASSLAQSPSSGTRLVANALAADSLDSAAPIFAASFKDFERKMQPLAQWKGKPMVVYFWATWCKSCKHEVPELIALYDKYKKNGLTVVGIAIDNTDKVVAFTKEYKINYPILMGSNDALNLSKQMGNKVGGLPFAVVINANGKVVGRILGETKPGKFEELVRPLAG
jgi:thiol-disulfide isomerase/thioredoxin